MLKRYTFWFSAAIIFQFVTGILHSFSLFIAASPENETERQMIELISIYKMNAGAGFAPRRRWRQSSS